MAFHDVVLNVLLSAIKPDVEEYLEDILAIILRYPAIRKVIKKNPDMFARGLSALIGSIPEMDKRTVLGRIEAFAKDVAESMPRELARAAKGEGTTKKGIKVEGDDIKVRGEKKVSSSKTLGLISPKKAKIPYLLRLPK